MQSPPFSSHRTSWNRIALLVIAGSCGAMAGCAEKNQSPVVQSIDPAAQTTPQSVQTMDWEMQWAQAALQRNPNLEVMAADRESRIFTVRDRQTDTTTQVQLGQIAAAPVALLTAPSNNSAPGGAAQDELTLEPATATSAEPESVAPDATSMVAAVTPIAPPARSTSYTIDRSDGQTKVSGTGISVVYGDSSPPTKLATPSEEPPKAYTIDRSSGVTRVNGPGVSIESSGQPRATAVLETTLAAAEIEPLICEGPRVMQLDNRTINVDGDALTARGGCELYITNSTIVASGTGVVIRDATVHINNSRIEGGMASFDAKEQAKVFLRGSTINGVSRRNVRAVIQDQGGNSYR